MASWSCGDDFLLDTAVLSVGIFEAQTQFRFVVFQVEQLLGVKGSSTLPGKKVRFQSKQEGTRKNKQTTASWAFTPMIQNTVCEERRHSLSDEVHGILVFHPTLEQSQGHQHRSSEDKQQRDETVRLPHGGLTRTQISKMKHHKALASQTLCHWESKTHKLWSHVINTAR